MNLILCGVCRVTCVCDVGSMFVDHARMKKLWTQLFATTEAAEAASQSESNLDWDYLMKFIIVGDHSVGKSSLLRRLRHDAYDTLPEMTIGTQIWRAHSWNTRAAPLNFSR